ncbi:MAG: alpha-L-fucosidase 2, partial [Rhodothermales bacterium]
ASWGQKPGALQGQFQDDYGIRYSVSEQEWQHHGYARYRVEYWNHEAQYLIAQNHAGNPTGAGLWTRIDWMQLDMPPFSWAFCLTEYEADSADEAAAAGPPNRDEPRTGCGGYPFSRMKPAVPGLELRFDEPAELFEEALVLGNGRIGATVYGGIRNELVHLNDATLWTGRPVDPRMNPTAHEHLPAVREALANEDWELADSLNRKLQGSFSQSYAPLGDLTLQMGHADKAEDYVRVLDLATATSSIRYKVSDTRFERQTFVSAPDSVIIMRLEASDPGALNVRLGFGSKLMHSVRAEGETLIATGEAPVHAEPSYRGNIPDAIIYEPGHGTRFAVMARVVDTDGWISATGGSLELNGASYATVVVSVATSFSGFDREPGLDGLDEIQLARTHLDAAAALTIGELQKRQQDDHREFFDRVSLDLGPDPAPALTTDDRLRRYSEGAADPYLEALYFQFGRYLLISSSRTPGAPANLQGIWNAHMRPPWSSNYTTNINAEMNYWPAEVTNLSEMHEPLLTFIENLAVTGRVTAETFWGTRGWSVAHNSDIWAMSNPVGDFGDGHPVWANWNMAGVWLSTHLWEHFAFTQDREFLAERAYPLMVGAAEFAMDWLVEGDDGVLITAPATSPENLYKTPDGYRGATTIATTADMAMIRELFIDLIEAAETLERDLDLRAELAAALERMAPYKIGRDGSLQEWYHDWEDADPKHRHQSHVFGLHPGTHITPRQTPALARAVRAALEIKGDESTGWSKGWRINLWARLLDGDRAHKLYRELLTLVEPSAGLAYSVGGGTYPNLLDAHPPFQIDGNFGGTAGVAEMLLQSHGDVIQLLPALPSAWQTGQVRGLRARGGFEIDLAWEDGSLTKATLKSVSATGPHRVRYGSLSWTVDLGPGETMTLKGPEKR